MIQTHCSSVAQPDPSGVSTVTYHSHHPLCLLLHQTVSHASLQSENSSMKLTKQVCFLQAAEFSVTFL